LTSALTAVYHFFVHQLALELQETLKDSPVRLMLSQLGRALYFPNGVVAQSVEALKQATVHNATVGIAQRNKDLVCLPEITIQLPGLTNTEICAYAPTAGVPELRQAWAKQIQAKNPLLKDVPSSLPIVTGGITHGVSLAADLFADEGDTVILPELFWGNYRLIFEMRRKAVLRTYPLFDGTGLNVNGLEAVCRGTAAEKLVILLNFPHNPTGYSPTTAEAHALADLLLDLAHGGKRIVAMIDDAYFGLFYEKRLFTQSLFSLLAGLHDNILAVKLDGATKEELGWGLRIGFLTYGAGSLTPDQYGALEKKTMAAIRSSVSSCCRVSQSLLIHAMQNPAYHKDKAKFSSLLKERYVAVKKLLKQKNTDILSPLPFNSGFFLTFHCNGLDAERIRRLLLERHGIGTVAVSPNLLRVAYSNLDTAALEDFFSRLYSTAEALIKG